MSYEKPILVRTTEELDIWFGKDFKDYSYLQELINMGIVLYLYKPTSSETIGGEGYIDLDNYVEDDEVWLRDVELEWIGKVVKSPENYKFRYNNGSEIKTVGLKVSSGGDLVVVENIDGREFCTEETVRKELLDPINQISRIYKNPIKFHVFNSDDLWIYKDGGIFDIELLPQNINLTSSSSDNRDTLIVSTPELDTISFTYLDYNSETDSFGIYENKDLVDQLEDIDQRYIGEIDPEKVATGYQTLMFSISGEQSFSEEDYFVIPNANHGTDLSLWGLFYFNLDKVPKKYDGLDGTELAISESQERMAIVIEAKDEDFIKQQCYNENLEVVKIATVTNNNRLVMHYLGQTIVDIDRAFLDKNGASRYQNVFVELPDFDKAPFENRICKQSLVFFFILFLFSVKIVNTIDIAINIIDKGFNTVNINEINEKEPN